MCFTQKRNVSVAALKQLFKDGTKKKNQPVEQTKKRSFLKYPTSVYMERHKVNYEVSKWMMTAEQGRLSLRK